MCLYLSWGLWSKNRIVERGIKRPLRGGIPTFWLRKLKMGLYSRRTDTTPGRRVRDGRRGGVWGRLRMTRPVGTQNAPPGFCITGCVDRQTERQTDRPIGRIIRIFGLGFSEISSSANSEKQASGLFRSRSPRFTGSARRAIIRAESDV